MRRKLRVGVVLAVSAVGAWGQAPANAKDAWDRLAAGNNMDVKGNSPFDLEIAFQLYDMSGKPTRSGTVKDWWGAPGSERIIVKLAGLNEDGSLPAGASHELMRDQHLVNELLNFAVHPVPEDPPANEKITDEKETFGKLHLNCLGPETRVGSEQAMQWESICRQPEQSLVLLVLGKGGDEVMARQSTGKFHDTDVALKLRVAYLGHNMITGEVTRLQSFDAAKPEVKLISLSPEDDALPNGPMHTEVLDGNVRGKTINFVEPRLPDRDREGRAMLQLVIGRDGSVRDVAPIACSDAAFCDVAEKAYRQSTYSPSVLSGRAVEVSNTVTVTVWKNHY